MIFATAALPQAAALRAKALPRKAFCLRFAFACFLMPHTGRPAARANRP
jgi:hypothetical protein